jgi:hypothetical protein
MFPSQSLNDAPYARYTDSMLASQEFQFRSLCPFFANRRNLVCGQFGPAALFSLGSSVVLVTIIHVFFRRALANVTQQIVGRIAVHVPALHFRRTGANKRLQHKRMNEPQSCSRPSRFEPRQANFEIPLHTNRFQPFPYRTSFPSNSSAFANKISLLTRPSTAIGPDSVIWEPKGCQIAVFNNTLLRSHDVTFRKKVARGQDRVGVSSAPRSASFYPTANRMKGR